MSFETFRTGHDHSWVGLILGPRTPPDVDADPWYPPARAAWVVTDGDGETVIDTAKMSWEYEQ